MQNHAKTLVLDTENAKAAVFDAKHLCIDAKTCRIMQKHLVQMQKHAKILVFDAKAIVPDAKTCKIMQKHFSLMQKHPRTDSKHVF